MILLKALWGTFLWCIGMIIIFAICSATISALVWSIIGLLEYLFTPIGAAYSIISVLGLALLTAFGMMTYERYLELSGKGE